MVSPDQENMMMMVVNIVMAWWWWWQWCSQLDDIFWPIWWWWLLWWGWWQWWWWQWWWWQSSSSTWFYLLTSMVDGIGGAEAVCSGERCSANRPWSVIIKLLNHKYWRLMTNAELKMSWSNIMLRSIDKVNQHWKMKYTTTKKHWEKCKPK